MRVTPEQILTGIGLTIAVSITAPSVRRMLRNATDGAHQDTIGGFAGAGPALFTFVASTAKSTRTYLMEAFDDLRAEVDYDRQQIRARRRPIEQG